MAKTDRPKRRMLLIASLGVASVSYVVACEHHGPLGGHDPGAGNGTAPPPTVSPVSGNLPAPIPQPQVDAATSDTDTDAGSSSVSDWMKGSPTAGNLMVHAPASASAKPPRPIPPPRHNPIGGNLAAPSSQ